MKEESNMKYFSESYFRNIANTTPLYEQRTFSEEIKGAPLDKHFDVFLSYNISDLNVVKGIYYVLSKMGLQVYLDCIVDADLKRNETDKNTAKRLQKRLISNVQKITSAENLRSRASDEIVPFREFIIKDDTSALL